MFKYIKTVVVFLFVFAILALPVQAASAILNTTLRKTSENGLNFTFYTKEDNGDKPIVKDKGANHYVILLPGYTGSSSLKPDLRTVSELVETVDVKTVNEGAVAYTKVAIITKKPVKINAEMRKTTQSSTELSGVSDIVARVSLINQDIASSKKLQAETTSLKPSSFSNVQDILNNKVSQENIKPAVSVKPEKLPVAAPLKTVNSHVPTNTKAIKTETKNLKNENIRNIKEEAVKNIDKIEQNIQRSFENNVAVNEEKEELSPVVTDLVLPEIEDVQKNKFSISKVIASPLILIVLFAMTALATVMFIIGRMRSVLADTRDMSNSFVERMNSSILTGKKDYAKIAQDETLTWQQKYKTFKEGKVKDSLERLNSHIGIEVDDDLDIVEDVAATPVVTEPVETPFIEESPNPFASEYQEVRSSGDVIAHSMKRTIKAFADERSLVQTRRNVGLKNRFHSFETIPTADLQRNMSQLLDTVIKMEEEVPQTERIMNTVPTPQVAEPQGEVSNTVMSMTSPIENAQPQAKKKMKIKQSRAIDENKGFYLVDMEDKVALMGRINDRFTVLKKFEDKAKATLQVRRDKDNLYMVRTDGFKALVDVTDSKMGVLAEL